ncbi:MAG TPA: SDR family NAD(P)-dependent oxidoreductase, partial [Deltaproteobacteria bacterium]|nr:SDR family NAD(P)-dependent oxidoreductase [Deltaproteobacteria bacterium]
MPFTDKVVWITGASSGIGEALAYAFSRSGARLVLSSRSVERLNEVKDQCHSPDLHMVLPLDLLDSSDP